ncbi:MAG: radical SAM protein [Deltaproteobacteria bacterium]|nr:radical SAM protein [Deltaproteobacteria bacterium]
MTTADPAFSRLAAEFASLASDDRRARGVPLSLHIDLTYRCDLDCEHCYLDRKTDWPELRNDELLDLVDQAADLGVLRLTWSGGEPFARPDFESLVERASQHGLVSRIKTHAGNITAARAAWLASQVVDRVEVSVYSLNARVHDAITRVPGSFEATLQGIAEMRRIGVEVSISWVAMRSSVHEGADLLRYFSALGCRVSIGVGIQPDNGLSQGIEQLDLGDTELVQAYRVIQQQRIMQGDDDGRVVRLDATAAPCGAARSSVYVAPDGAVTPCVMFPMEIGHLREQTLAEIWHQSERRKEIVAWTNADRSDCLSCSAGGNCFYCPGEAFKRTGDFRAAPDVFHQRTRAKMKAFEAEYGHRFEPAFWAGIPEHTEAPPRVRKAHFPILRPGTTGSRRNA